jgi:hypothetical protein
MVRVVAMPIAGGSAITAATAMMGLGLVSAIPFVVGIATALSATVFSLNTLAKVFVPKQYKKHETQREFNKMLRDIANEEYDAKEQEVLACTQKALKTANKILKEQRKEIIYSRGEGFIIKSDEPVVSSKWDALRLETLRNRGIELSGGAKLKELVA